MAAKKTLAGKTKMSSKEFRDLPETIDKANKAMEAGLMTAKAALKTIPKDYQSVVSKQFELSKLLEDEDKKRKGIEGSFRKGLGLSYEQADVTEIQENLTQAILAGDEDAAKAAEEKIEAMQEQAKLQGEAYEDIKDFFPGIFSAIKTAQKAQKLWNQIAMKHPFVAIAAVLLAIAAVLMMLAKRVNAIREEFGLTVKESMRLNREIMQVNMKMKLFGISAEQVSASMGALSSKFGEVGPAMVQFAGDMARVARNSGITAENAAQMVSLFQATHGVTKEVALDMIESTNQMAALTGLAPGVILKEMVENADLFASHLGQSEQNLIAAVAQAKKLGMEFGELNEFGDGLLDITERINKEQMLSAMLGKQVNLQKAAMLHAQGDEVGFMQEMANQLQGVGELTAQQRRLFTAELGIATADVMKLAGLQSGMAGKSAAIPGQNPYEQKTYKQGERILKAINQPAYAR